jgi:hypothetical protein
MYSKEESGSCAPERFFVCDVKKVCKWKNTTGAGEDREEDSRK